MKAYHGTAVLKFDDDTTGNAASGASVTVRVNSSQALATIFDVDDIGVANPLTADANGNYAFKAADNIYDIIIQEGTPDEVKLQKVEIAEIPIPSGLINDLSQAYEFATVAEYKAFATEFPVGKVINLLDRGAGFTVIAGTGTANTFNIIASDEVLQSIDLAVNGSVNTKAWGIVGDNSADDTAAWLELGVYLETNDIVVIGDPDDEYKITSDVNVKASLNFKANGASFKPVACNGLVIGKEQPGAFATVTSDIAINTDNIIVDNVGIFSVGDLVKILSSESWMLDPSPSEDLRKGEFNKINRIVGNTIYFEKLMSDNYLVGGSTIKAIKIEKIKVNIDNLNIDFGDNEPRLGIEVRGDDNGKIKSCTVNKAQIQGMNIINCYKTRVLNHTNHESNNTGTGYGIQINASTDIKAYHGAFTGCRRGIDISGDIPTRGCDVAFNDADGSGIASDGSNMPSNSGSSGFGSHETSEFNRFRSNKISGVKSGILLRGKDELVTDNYFYQDVNISCVQISKAINYTVENNHSVAGLRPGKVLVTADEQQKTPWFLSMTDPAIDGGFYKVINNTFDDIKNAFMVITLTVNAPFTALTNMTITGNSGTVNGDGNGTVYFLQEGDQPVTIQDSTIINNDLNEGVTTFEMYDPNLDIDYQNSVDIDNYHFNILDDILISGGGGTLTRQRFDLNMSIKNGEVNITGFVEFDITGSPVNVKMQNLPTKAVTGGSYGPAYGFPYVADVTTGGVGNHGMIAMPGGTSGSIPTSAWVSFDLLTYNTPFPVANGYKVPLVFKYYTERRRV